MQRAERTGFQRLNAVLHVVHGAGRTGKVENVVHLAAIEWLVDIQLAELKSRIPAQMLQVGSLAGDQVVDRKNVIPFRQQRVAQVRAKKSCTPRDQRPRSAHAFLNFLVAAEFSDSPSSVTVARPML